MAAPPWLDKFNYIDFWSEVDCEAPWTVYFETAWPALGRAAMVLVGFDTGDMVRSIFRPSGQRQGRHGRKGRRSGKGFRGIPEPSELIARNIPGHEARATRYVDDGVRHLWKIDGHLQRAANRIMYFNLFNDFMYEWNTAFLTDPRTDCANLARALYVNEDHLTLAHGWGLMATGDKVYEHGDIEVHTFAVNLGPGTYLINQAAKVKPASETSDYTEVQLGLNRQVEPVNFLGLSSRQKVYRGNETTLVVTGTVKLDFPGHVNFAEFTFNEPATWTEITTRIVQCGD